MAFIGRMSPLFTLIATPAVSYPSTNEVDARRAPILEVKESNNEGARFELHRWIATHIKWAASDDRRRKNILTRFKHGCVNDSRFVTCMTKRSVEKCTNARLS
jgi:hypothetical protein